MGWGGGMGGGAKSDMNIFKRKITSLLQTNKQSASACVEKKLWDALCFNFYCVHGVLWLVFCLLSLYK